jgi:hypothetical protein
MSDGWVALARSLDESTDLWSHLPDAQRAAERERVASGGYPINLDLLNGWVFADGEDLAEGGVETFLEELAPHLHTLCDLVLKVRAVEVPFGEIRDPIYTVEINDIRCPILYADDLTFEPYWRLATLRPLATVNELLDATPARRRMHTLYAGGNEGLAFVMDPRVPAAMRASGVIPDNETPRLATADEAA